MTFWEICKNVLAKTGGGLLLSSPTIAVVLGSLGLRVKTWSVSAPHSTHRITAVAFVVVSRVRAV